MTSITIEDLIKAGKEEVRKNKVLMTAYISLFKEKFGREPYCAGCTFNNDWIKLVKINSLNFKIKNMENVSFKVRDPHKIYTYRKNNEKTGVSSPVRSFGYNMTEEFAISYLTNGTSEQIEERKKEFKILPEKLNFSKEKKYKYPNKLVEMKTYAIEKGYDENEFKNIKIKDDMMAYLESKEQDENIS